MPWDLLDASEPIYGQGQPYLSIDSRPRRLDGMTHVTSDPDRVGWRRLAHPGPPAGAGRPAQPPGPPRQGPARGAPLGGPHALLVGLALVPDRRRPRRPRRLRHPRDQARHPQAVPVTYRSIKARTFLDDL